LVCTTVTVTGRNCSTAPTVMTFLAVAGAWMRPGRPPLPLSLPPPLLPAENTNSSGCAPGSSGRASRVAAS